MASCGNLPGGGAAVRLWNGATVGIGGCVRYGHLHDDQHLWRSVRRGVRSRRGRDRAAGRPAQRGKCGQRDQPHQCRRFRHSVGRYPDHGGAGAGDLAHYRWRVRHHSLSHYAGLGLHRGRLQGTKQIRAASSAPNGRKRKTDSGWIRTDAGGGAGDRPGRYCQGLHLRPPHGNF